MELEIKSKEVDQESKSVEIDETVEETPEVDISVLSPKEQELAKKHGFDKKEETKNEHKEQSEDAAKVSDEKEKGKEEVKETLPTFEEIENDEKHLEKYNPNEKALYWKWKNDKRKRQDTQKKVDELQARLELETVKDRASSIKLKKISEMLNSTDGELTVEAINKVINGDSDTREETEKPLTRSDLDRIESEKSHKLEENNKAANEQKQRLAIAEEIGKTKYKNFNELVELAKEVVAEDKTGTYQEILNVALSDPNFDEEKLIDRVVTIAKLSNKYGKESVNGTEKKEKVEKVIDNSKKKISSASLSSSGGKRTIVEDDLTVEDAARLSSDQWSSLSQKTRKRILGG